MATVDMLDLTCLPAEQQPERLVGALDALPIGNLLEVQTGPMWEAGSRHVLTALQEQRWGRFDWRPLTKGGDSWLAELVHLGPGDQHSTIHHFFTRDHHRCDALYAETEGAAQEGDIARMSRLCHRFLVAMAHHFNMEETGLFPAFENRTGMRQGPTMVMRSEHEQMRGLMQQMHQAAETGDDELLLKAGGTLLFVMQQHNVKEEQMLYPMSENHLRPADLLLKEVQRL
ncbi:MAG: hemerythrin domain-containing protein [Magnetococcus sp. MYC-9]